VDFPRRGRQNAPHRVCGQQYPVHKGTARLAVSAQARLLNERDQIAGIDRAPSAGFSQGWGFLVLDNPGDVARFRDAVRPESDPENWFAANVEAPLVIVALSNKQAYLDRYAQPDKGFTDRSDSWWPAPYWDIDTGFAALLMWLTATDARLAACFFGIPIDRIEPFRSAFAVPPQFTPIGAVSIGYDAEPPGHVSAMRERARA
jgi:nitroreductase